MIFTGNWRKNTVWHVRLEPHRRRPPTALVRQIVGETFKSKDQQTRPKYVPELMAWGNDKEDEARRVFVSMMKKDHLNLEVHETGIKIPPGCGHFGGSVDGIVECDCGRCPEKAVVEIKAPFSISNEDSSTIAVARKLPWLKISGSGISLNTND